MSKIEGFQQISAETLGEQVRTDGHALADVLWNGNFGWQESTSYRSPEQINRGELDNEYAQQLVSYAETKTIQGERVIERNGRQEYINVLHSPEQLDPENTVFVVAAHADDVLFAAGILMEAMNRDAYVVLVDMTNGAARPTEYSADELVDVRKNEAIEAARIMGIGTYINLGFPDGELKNSHNLEDGEFSLTQYMRVYNPKMVIAHGPDYHGDHNGVRNITDNIVDSLFKSRNNNDVLPGIPVIDDGIIPNFYEMQPQGLLNEQGQIAKANMLFRISKETVVKLMDMCDAYGSQMLECPTGREYNYKEQLEMELITRGLHSERWRYAQGIDIGGRRADQFHQSTENRLTKYFHHNDVKVLSA